MKRALFYVVVFILVQLLASYCVYTVSLLIDGYTLRVAVYRAVAGAIRLTPAILIISSAVYSLVLLVLFLSRRWCRVSRSYLQSWPVAVFFWTAIAALGTVIPSEVLNELLPMPDINSEAMVGVITNRWGYMAVCIFAPLVEEIVFRGAVLGALLQSGRGHWGPILVSAVLFAVVHINPAQMPHAFLMGLLLGWLYARTGSILPGVLLHWVNNTVVYVVFNLFPNLNKMTLLDLFGGDWKRVALSVVFSFLILIPALVQLNMRMKRVE